jgi:hypothetical protein
MVQHLLSKYKALSLTKVERRNRGDEPMWVIIHRYMEMSQGNSCTGILSKQNVFFSKTKNRMVKQFLFRGWYHWDIRKGCRRVNMAEILGVHV